MKAVDYANSLDASIWEFAVDLPSLRRLWVGNNDLRWLVASGFVDYAIETTKSCDNKRTFQTGGRLRFGKRTCFVLTPKGAEIAKATSHEFDLPAPQSRIPGEPVSLLTRQPSPRWDQLRQELLVGKIIVKRFRVPAPSQEVILAAFEEDHWPARIDDPLSPHSDQCPKRRLQETIKSLNRNQRHPLIRFLGDGSGQGVLWEYCGAFDDAQASNDS